MQELSSQAELFNDCTITFDIVVLEVTEKAAAVAYHLVEAAAAVVVLLVRLEVLCKRVDSVGENSDLNFRGTCVAFVNLIGIDDFLLFFLCEHDAAPFTF